MQVAIAWSTFVWNMRSIRQHRIRDMRAIAIDDPVARTYVSQSVCLSHRPKRWIFLIRQMAPVRCGHYYITVPLVYILF